MFRVIVAFHLPITATLLNIIHHTMSLASLSQPCTSRTGLLLSRGKLTLPSSTRSSAKTAALATQHTIPFNRPRPFSSTRPTRASHFDTHLFVERLKANGLNKEQAEGIMTVLAEVVEESINGMETTMVSKAEQEKVRQLGVSLYRRGPS